MNPAIGREGKHLYEFGPFRLDPAERVLVRDGERVSLAPKAFDTLFILVQHSGHALTKDELIKTLWPDSFVEENNLTQQISQLRRALGERTDGETYIETVPKLGYRFVPDVRQLADGKDEGELVLSRRTRTHIVVREEEEQEEGEDFSEEAAAAGATQALTRVTSQAITAPATLPAPTTVSRRLKLIFTSLALFVATVAGLLSYRALRLTRSAVVLPAASMASVAPRHSVLVLGFKNLSGRAADDWLSPALSEMLTTELRAGGQLRIVPGEEVQRIKSDLGLEREQSLAKPTLTQIRNRVGADIIVSGSYVEVGREPHTQIRLDLQLQDASAGETVFSTAVSGTSEELFSLVSRSGSQLRSKLGVPMLSDLEGAQDQAAMPSTPEAARFYSEGLSRLRLFDAPAAEKLLTRAVNIDPNFALGHSALASAWSALGYDEKAKSEARRALDLSVNLSRQENLLLAGQYSEFTRNWEQAVATYQNLFNLFPDNADYGLRLAGAQTSAGKGKDALATLEKLRKLPPPANQDPRIDLAQAEAADSLGDFKQELGSAERAIQNGTALGERLLVARGWTKKSWAMRRLGQTQEAIADLLQAKKIFSETGDLQGVGSTLRLIGGSLSEQGNYAQAEKNYEEAISIFRRIGDRRALAMSINGLGVAHYESGDLRGARALDEQYLEIEREVGSKINTAGALGNIGNVEDGMGNLAEARRLNEESLKIFSEVGDQRALGTALGNLASVLYEQGDLESARTKLDEALAIKRKIGYQRGIAYDLSTLSEVLQAQGNPGVARQNQEEALKIRQQIGEEHNAAVSRLRLAALDLEDQKSADAEKIATEAAQEFAREKSAVDQAAAEEVVARSYLAQGKIPEAQAAISRARALAKGSSNLPLSFEMAETSARIRTAKTPVSTSAAASAEKDLESSLALARKCGYLEYEYKLRLALGELKLRTGTVSQGRSMLQALVSDASKTGFGLIASSATATLKAHPAPQR